MIGWAQNRDQGELRALFGLCFPGEEAFGDWFFRHVWRPERTLVWRQGRIQAMVQLLPLFLGGGGHTLPAEYVYALGTAPDCRGQGLASRLLEYARQTCPLRGGQALLLIPQEPSLFAYYRRLGYQTAFWAEEREIGPADLLPGYSLEQASEQDLDEAADFYREIMKNRLCPLRSQADFRLQLQLYQGNVWILRRQGRLEGWAFLERAPVFGAEVLGPKGSMAAAAVLARLGGGACLCRGLGLGGESRSVGMALPLTDRAAQAIAVGQGYCGLLFN